MLVVRGLWSTRLSVPRTAHQTNCYFFDLGSPPSTTRTMSTRPSRKRTQLDYKNPVRYMTDGEVKVAAMEEEEAAGKARRKKPRDQLQAAGEEGRDENRDWEMVRGGWCPQARNRVANLICMGMCSDEVGGGRSSKAVRAIRSVSFVACSRVA